MISSQSRHSARTVHTQRSAYAFAHGARTRREKHLGALGAEHVVETPGELRVTVTQQQLYRPRSLSQHRQQVAGLLGDPGAVGVGGHPAKVDPPGVELDEDQHIQPPQPDGVDREEVAGEDARRLLAQGRPPGRGRRSRRRVQPMAAQRGADRGCRDPYAEPEQLAVDALAARAWVLLGQADDQLLQLLVEWGSPGSAVRVGPGAGDQLPVPAQQVSGLTKKQDQRDRGKARLMAASIARSAGSNLGRGSGGAARPAGDGAPGSPGPWRRRRGSVARAAGWSGTASGRRGSTACGGSPRRSAETPHYRATHGGELPAHRPQPSLRTPRDPRRVEPV
jgi:hypothetical protein